MAQTFYIEADEEIISVVGRLRHTGDTEIALVVPKHAILMQSIVSLKLLEREAKKLGKIIMIVSQDDNGRALALKAGLQSRSYQEEQIRHEEEILPENNAIQAEPPIATFSEPKASYSIKAENIGSESFFNQNHAEKSNPVAKMPMKPEVPEKKSSIFHIAVRDKNTKYQMALNSEQPITPKNIPLAPKAPAMQRVSSSPGGIQKSSYSEITPPKNILLRKPSPITPPPTPSKTAPLPVAIHSKVKIAITGAGIVVLLLMATTAFFLFTPKATITVFPIQKKEQNSFEFRLIHAETSNLSQAEENALTLEIPYRLAEEKIDMQKSIRPTGIGTGGERKARGKVIIYNEFGSEPQSLVATTRLETAEGIVFRLTQGVTVPGMTDIAGKKEPGAIEAEVIADEAGDASNIMAEKFTIPGFKGSPKYSKFSAKSLTPMTGGSKNSTSGDAILSREDIDQAREQAKTEALETFRKKISETISDGEKIDDNSIELSSLPEEPLLHEGLTGTSIETVFHYQAKAYITSEKTIERAILRSESVDGKFAVASGMSFLPKKVIIDTIEMIPDFQSGGGKLKVMATLLLETEIQEDTLREELLGKKSDELRSVLDRHPEIIKMNLDVKPNFIVKYIPKNKERVNIVIGNAEQGSGTTQE